MGGAETAATRDAIPGTSWGLEGEGWREEDRAALAALAPRLPASYRHPPGGVRLRLADARPFDRESRHLLGRNGPAGITLYVRGLAERVGAVAREVGLPETPGAAEAAARYLLQRVAVHELTHVLDHRAGLSRRRAWRDLSGWSWLSHLPTMRPATTSGDFAAPWGASSPAEDLATFAEVYFVPPPLGPTDAEHAPRCLFPAKYAFLARTLDPHPDPAPEVRCSGPESSELAPARVGAIDVLWAAPSLAGLATVGGHLLIAVEILEETGSRWDAFAMVAETGTMPSNSARYALLGIGGGFPARVVRTPYEATRQRYVDLDNRDLLRFRWRLDDEEKARLLARLDDLTLHWRRPYLFFQQNCSALVLELANVVERRPVRPPPVVPPDLVLAELARRGRIQMVAPDPERDLSAGTLARLQSSAREEAITNVCGHTFRAANARDAATRGRAYREMAALAEATDGPSCWSELARVLALSAPLERALREAEKEPPPPANSAASEPSDPDPAAAGRDAAATVLRAHVSVEERLAARRAGEALALAAFVEDLPRIAGLDPSGSGSAAGLHTPYEPWTIGLRVETNGAAPRPAVLLERDAVDLVRGAPRVFGPARGVDLRVLSSQVWLGSTGILEDADAPETVEPGTGLWLGWHHTLLRLAWHPEALLRGPSVGWYAHALESEGATTPLGAWIDWAGAGANVTLASSRDGRHHLDLSAGVAARTRFGGACLASPLARDQGEGGGGALPAASSLAGDGWGGGVGDTPCAGLRQSWIMGPLELAGATAGDGRLRLDGALRLLPAWGDAPALGLEGAAAARIHLGSVGLTAVALSIGARQPWNVAGDLSLAPAMALAGLRWERW